MEGLISEESRVEVEREEALAELASKAFTEKRESIRRLRDDSDEVDMCICLSVLPILSCVCSQEAPPTKQPCVDTRPQQTSHSQKIKLSKLVVRKKKVSNKLSEEGVRVSSEKTNVCEVAPTEQSAVGRDSNREIDKTSISGSADGGPATGGLGLLCGYSDSSGESD